MESRWGTKTQHDRTNVVRELGRRRKTQNLHVLYICHTTRNNCSTVISAHGICHEYNYMGVIVWEPI